LGAGGERQASESFKWRFITALLYGGNVDFDERSTLPPGVRRARQSGGLV
jgi:hypothetical protein